MSLSDFLAQRRARYREINQRSLEWILSRSNAGPWINTKFNPIERRNYTANDNFRGPDYVYGWIQGRALEALIQHGGSCGEYEPALTEKLLSRSQLLYNALDTLYSKRGHACFCYDKSLIPVTTGLDSAEQEQYRDPDIFTYSDLFVVKGLIAASACHAPEHLDRHISALNKVVHAIESGHFLMNESGHVSHEALRRQEQDFGPRMIALGAASLLHSLELETLDSFSERFVQEVLDRHVHKASRLISNAPAGSVLNAGHAIELVGFHFETWGKKLSPLVIEQLGTLLADTFSCAFDGKGICLTIDLATGKRSDLSPWWSLPETIRAAALAFELTQDLRFQQIWEAADTVFFERFWLDTPPLALQMMRDGHAVDIVPATPDLDPGYHTGLSLLSASKACQRLATTSITH